MQDFHLRHKLKAKIQRYRLLRDSPLVIKGEPFFDLIFEYARLYSTIFIDRDVVPADAPQHNRFRSLIHIMNAEFAASEWGASLLYYARRFGADGLYEFCLQLEKVYLAQWVNGVRKDERFADYAKVLGSIESAKRKEDILQAITYDAQSIRDAVGRRDLYSVGFGKYILLRLELIAAEHDCVREFTAKSVEHVLPQNPDKTGYWADHHNLGEIDQYVNTVGNLVLLSKSKNSAASNFDFAKKKEQYLKNRVSDYPRSIQVLGYTDWAKGTVMERTAEAQMLILQDP